MSLAINQSILQAKYLKPLEVCVEKVKVCTTESVAREIIDIWSQVKELIEKNITSFSRRDCDLLLQQVDRLSKNHLLKIFFVFQPAVLGQNRTWHVHLESFQSRLLTLVGKEVGEVLKKLDMVRRMEEDEAILVMPQFQLEDGVKHQSL